MSRIDEALRIWERANGTVVAELEATEPGHLSPFREYESEEPDRQPQDPPALARAGDMALPPLPETAAPPITVQQPSRPDHGDTDRCPAHRCEPRERRQQVGLDRPEVVDRRLHVE